MSAGVNPADGSRDHEGARRCGGSILSCGSNGWGDAQKAGFLGCGDGFLVIVWLGFVWWDLLMGQ